MPLILRGNDGLLESLVSVNGGALTREEQGVRTGRSCTFMCDDPLADLITTNSESHFFGNYKPSESDLEDDGYDDSEDGDPSTWYIDDQDDGLKGQDIIGPDPEDMSYIICVNTMNREMGTQVPHGVL